MSSLRKTLLGGHVYRSGLQHKQVVDYTPIKWSKYFDNESKVTIDSGIFHIYTKGDEGPIIFCLHGGGYSGLTWALFAEEISNLIKCQIVAPDLRGHGDTTTNDNYDLSLNTLAGDVIGLLEKLYADSNAQIILVGHSMGGAIAVQVTNIFQAVAGLCVIDVVEGTALDALSSMQSILRARPNKFKSVQHAIQWCHRGGQTFNVEAARVSMPGQIINIKTGVLAANELDQMEELALNDDAPIPINSSTCDTIKEDDEETDEAVAQFTKPPLPPQLRANQLPSDLPFQYTWRIDLSKTEKFWTGWFEGMSDKFLNPRMPKLLLLANINGLDTSLTIGQMQGKFQLQVLAKSGHAIHEDQPQHVAEIIGGYLVKQKIVEGKPNMTFSMPAC